MDYSKNSKDKKMIPSETPLIIYCRVSTTDQNVKQQGEYTKRFFKKLGYPIIRVILDKESGTLPLTERTRFKRLLDIEYIKSRGVKGIGIYNLDRLTRNWYDENMVEQFFTDNWDEVKLLSTAEPIDLDNANGRAMFRFKMVINCLMPEDMKEKQKIGIARAKKEGKYKGRKKGARNK